MAARGLVSRIAFAFSPTSAPLQPAGDAEAGRKRRDEWNGRWDAVFEDSDSDATRGGMPDSPEWPNGPPRYFEDGDGRSRCCSFFLASRTLRTVILTALATALVTYFVVAGDGSAWKNVVSGSLDVPGIVDDADAIIPPPDDEMVADDFETEPVVPVADNFATETSEAIVGSSSTTSISTSPSPALIPSPPPCPSAAPIPAPPAPASPAAPTQPPLEPEKDQFELPDFPNLLSTSSPLTTWPLINPPKDKFHRVPPGIPRPFCPIKAFDEYARWHAKILSGDFSSVEKDPDPEHRRPRFIIYTCRPHVDGQQDPCGGLADRIVGIVTTVMFGMLSGRVALVDFQRDTKATDVFMPVGIDWTVVIEDFVAKHNLNASGDYRTLRLNYHNPTKRAVEQLSTMKFDDWWHEPIVRIEINRGLTWMMYDNPHYKTQIKRWAWNRENLFACLMDFILTPVPRIAEMINQNIVPVLDPMKFTVGLQIRTGDLKAFGTLGDNTTVENFPSFFLCANKLHQRLGYGRPLQIFLVTDSMSLKTDAERVYGDALLSTEAVPQHLGITNRIEAFRETAFGPIKANKDIIDQLNKLNQTKDAKAEYNETDAYYGAILELWTLSYAPFKVISRRSGFGNVAAFRRYWTNPRAVVRYFEGFNGYTCGMDTAWTNYTDLATHWSMGRRKRKRGFGFASFWKWIAGTREAMEMDELDLTGFEF